MKNLIKISKAIIMVMFVIAFGTLSSANATTIEITPETTIGFHFYNLPNSGKDSSQDIVNAILGEGLDNPGNLDIIYSAIPNEPEAFVTWLCETSFSSNGSEATITPMSASNIYGSGELWLLVKDGEQGHYLFDLFHLTNVLASSYQWNGTDALHLSGFYPDQGSISHIALYSSVPRNQVPEPSSIILLGLGLVGLTLFGRQKIKK